MIRTLTTFLFVLCFGIADLYACKCAEAAKLSHEALSRYEIIFTGRVAAVSGDEQLERVQFTVLELYKGAAYQTIELQHNPSTDCSFSFAPGETWTIYGSWMAYGVPTTNFCTHTRRQPVTAADDFESETRSKYAVELQYLRDSIGVVPFNDPSEHKDMLHKNELPGPATAFGYLAAGLIGLAVIFFFVRRMFKRDGK
jgi:hypothetical protein